MADLHPAADIWPPARLRVTTPRLELRLPTDEEIVELAAAATRGIHDPDTMPFASPWSDAPADELARSMYSWHCQLRGAWQPTRWTILFAVFVDGQPVGAQDVAGSSFGVRRQVATASWLAQEVQGRGIGTEMRAAALQLAFEALGAAAAISGAYEENVASQRVSEKCGYEPNGLHVVARSRGANAPDSVANTTTCAIERLYRITHEQWLPRRRDDIVVSGLDDELRAMLGATD
jgi:RimJ/RimL family protein N-acetyltransferase